MKKGYILILTLIIIHSCVYENDKAISRLQEYSGPSNPNKPNSLNGQYKDNSEINSSNGKELYESKCSTCHIKSKKDYMLGSSPIIVDLKYLKCYLNNHDSLVSVKDSLVLLVKKEYGNSKFSHGFNLSDDEVESISAFILK